MKSSFIATGLLAMILTLPNLATASDNENFQVWTTMCWQNQQSPMGGALRSLRLDKVISKKVANSGCAIDSKNPLIVSLNGLCRDLRTRADDEVCVHIELSGSSATGKTRCTDDRASFREILKMIEEMPLPGC